MLVCVVPGNVKEFVMDKELREEVKIDTGLAHLPSVNDESRASGKQDPMYKDEHCDLYREFGLEWPADISKFKHICFNGMNPRTSEVVILMDAMFPAAEAQPDGHEFFDANPSMKRILALEAGKYKSPWKVVPLTITGQTQLMVRSKIGDKARLRRMEIAEMFSLIGWFPDVWGPETARLHDVLDPALASSLTGNAFSAFHVGPVLLAFLGTMCSPSIDPPIEEAAATLVSDDSEEEFSD